MKKTTVITIIVNKRRYRRILMWLENNLWGSKLIESSLFLPSRQWKLQLRSSWHSSAIEIAAGDRITWQQRRDTDLGFNRVLRCTQSLPVLVPNREDIVIPRRGTKFNWMTSVSIDFFLGTLVVFITYTSSTNIYLTLIALFEIEYVLMYRRNNYLLDNKFDSPLWNGSISESPIPLP